MTITDIHAGYLSGASTPSRCIEQVLARIAAADRPEIWISRVDDAALRAQARALDAVLAAEGTAALPEATFEVPTSPYGSNTVDAMRHGVTHAIRGLVQTMAERWAEEQGTWPEVIATGGDAAALFDGWEIVHAVSPDLIFYGLALAYTNHHTKHGT